MNKIELSLHIEANYPISGRGSPRKLLHGIGVNDADYTTTPMVNGVRLWDPAYSTWVSVLKRSYNQEYHEAHPTYSDVTVCKEWYSFIAFREWWLGHYREGFSLDKDLLSAGNREYAPDVCAYIPSRLNAFTTASGAGRGELPVGVSFCNKTGKYQSHCSNPITGKLHNLGLFTTPEAAHSAWLKFKLELADQLKTQMDAIDLRIHPNVVTIIKAAV